MDNILRESFKNTRKFVYKGVFALLFYFSAILTLKDGILPLLSYTFPQQTTTTYSNSTAEVTNSTTYTEEPSFDLSTDTPTANDLVNEALSGVGYSYDVEYSDNS